MTLRREVLSEGRWFIGTDVRHSIEDEVRNIARLAGQPNEGLWIARLEGRLVGMVSMICPPFARTQHVVKLEILVEKRVRGQGVGKALLDEAIAWARRSEPVLKVGLAVFDDNERALGLYRSRGFSEEGRRTAEYRMEDGSLRGDVLLQLWVGPDA